MAEGRYSGCAGQVGLARASPRCDWVCTVVVKAATWCRAVALAAASVAAKAPPTGGWVARLLWEALQRRAFQAGKAWLIRSDAEKQAKNRAGEGAVFVAAKAPPTGGWEAL